MNSPWVRTRRPSWPCRSHEGTRIPGLWSRVPACRDTLPTPGGLPDPTENNNTPTTTGGSIKSSTSDNDGELSRVSIAWEILILNNFINLKFEFNWVSHIFSDSLFHCPQCTPGDGQKEDSWEAAEHRPCRDRTAGSPSVPCSRLTAFVTPEP